MLLQVIGDEGLAVPFRLAARFDVARPRARDLRDRGSDPSSMAMESMLPDPCAQPSSRTSMPLCFEYALVASCGLSSMPFPMAVCGNVAMGFAARCCVPGRYWAVWRRSCALAGCCRPRCATGCLSGLRATCGGHAHGVPGRPVPSRSARWLRGGLGVRHGIVPGGGLRRSLCPHVDCLDGRFAYAAVLAFGLGAGCRRKGKVTGTSCTRYPPGCTTKRWMLCLLGACSHPAEAIYLTYQLCHSAGLHRFAVP